MTFDWAQLPNVNLRLNYIEGTALGHTVEIWGTDWTSRKIFFDKKVDRKDQVPPKTFYMEMPDHTFLYGRIIKQPARRT